MLLVAASPSAFESMAADNTRRLPNNQLATIKSARANRALAT